LTWILRVSGQTFGPVIGFVSSHEQFWPKP
jgi:hypothetical protein